MSELAQYILGVIVIPAVIAAVIALPFAVRPLRERRVLAEAGVACALMAAFVASFTTELGWTPIVRQFVAIEGDDAPFEKWHRLATIAIGLGAVAWLIAAARSGGEGSRATVGIGAGLAVAAAMAMLARFPGESIEMRLVLGGLAVAGMFGFIAYARSVMLWAAWLVFGTLAFLMGESGNAYLAVMSGAMSAASFAVAVLLWIGARAGAKTTADAGAAKPRAVGASPRGVAAPIVLGAFAAVLAVSGHAYDQTEIPSGYWYAAALLPYMVLLGEILIRPSVMRRRTLLAFLALFVGAGALVGIYAMWRASETAAVPSNDQEMLDSYGS